MNKNSIRKLFIQKRIGLSNTTQIHVSKTICETILNLHCYKNSQTIGLYMAINNEIDISFVWRNAIDNNKQCYFPKVTDKNSMLFLPANNLANFTKNKWGILEPTTNEISACPTSKLDLLILPLVAFDNLGNRIGMGKGFYDKALANNCATTLIGVAYDFQKVPLIKSETWDVKLDIIVTEKMIYSV